MAVDNPAYLEVAETIVLTPDPPQASSMVDFCNAVAIATPAAAAIREPANVNPVEDLTQERIEAGAAEVCIDV
jgi:hypothetical protein